MAQIKLARSHNLKIPEAHKRVEEIAAKLKIEYSAIYEWRGETLSFTANGVKGTIIVGSSDVKVDIRLAGIVAIAEPTIREKVIGHLQRAFPK